MHCKIPSPLDWLVLFLAALAFILHTVGIIFPMWWTVHEEDVLGIELTFHYGIWAIVDCKEDNCTTTSSIMHGDRAWLIGPAVLVVLADVLLLVVMVTTLVYLFQNQHVVLLRRLCVVFSAGGSCTIIMALLIFYKKKAGLRPSDAPETSDGDPDWSFLLSTFGAVVAVFQSVACGLSVKRLHKPHNTGKHKTTIFGIETEDMEVDINALRRGELSFGKNVNNMPNGVSPALQ
ncbi:hypothetical protein ACF0H5_015205 [Mactra antiquata]